MEKCGHDDGTFVENQLSQIEELLSNDKVVPANQQIVSLRDVLKKRLASGIYAKPDAFKS
jgi:hypothetical protein